MRCDQLPVEGDQKENFTVHTTDSPDPTTLQNPDSPPTQPPKSVNKDDVPLLANGKLVAAFPAADKRLSADNSERADSVPAVSLPAGNGKDDKKGEKNTRQESTNRRPAPPSRHPDGGYGWVIVFACFLQQV